jgi:hypothetical protein
MMSVVNKPGTVNVWFEVDAADTALGVIEGAM